MWSELKASEPQTEDEVLTSFSPQSGLQWRWRRGVITSQREGEGGAVVVVAVAAGWP